jgi:hypothetical protein
MKYLPKIGDLVVEHYINDDAGIDIFNYYRMVNSIVDNDMDVYILKIDYNYDKYNAVTHADFEPFILSHDEGFNDEVIDPSFSVCNVDQKEIVLKKNEKKYSIVEFNVFKNEYVIFLSTYSSDKVFNDISQELNDMITHNNFKKYIGKSYKYKVKWKKDGYEWELVS